MSRTVALLTDFGTTDTYVGVMKGVMLNICLDLQFVDLTHAVQPQNVKQAAFLLLNSYAYFPPGTVFLVVVDPGVGSSRKPIAVQAGGYTFVAPDNGVLSYVLRELDAFQAVELANTDYQLPASRTFHGRDIFAPAAAHQAAGVKLDELGGRVEAPVMLPDPALVVEPRRVRGEILHIDHFGTLVTSIGILNWESHGELALEPRFSGSDPLSIPASSTVRVGAQEFDSICHTYAEVAPGKALALVGSSGYLELSVNQGSFAAQSGVKIGDPVELQIG